MSGRDGRPPVPEPPFAHLRERLSTEADTLERSGATAAARTLREATQEWWVEQSEWNARVAELLSVHHEINNALVGVRGNAQLILMNPGSQSPGIRERLEVVLRESSRIQEAAVRLRDLKGILGGDVPGSRAA